jgi:murein DD-endopeptidase MepM/ murein hydrolase activator NlpD
MRFLIKWLFILVLLAGIGAAGAYYYAGTLDAPAIAINQPSIIGQASTLDVTVDAPRAELSSLSVSLQQGERSSPLFDLDGPAAGTSSVEGNRLRITRPVGKQAIPELQNGSATIRVAASRRVMRGLRELPAESTKDVQVRLTPPTVSVVSTHHYVNLGGAEMVVYRVNPADVESGVQVGDVRYPGFPGSGAGLRDPALRVAFFALAYNQARGSTPSLYARDAAGNEARAQFEHRIFPKVFRSSRIPLDDAFLSRVVPAILQGSPQVGANPTELLPSFLTINNDLRRINNETIAALAQKTSSTILWDGAFQSLGGSQVESSFADFRTYFYGGKEVDRQVHLGFDLAKTANADVMAANNGKVVYAADLGIYGNCVVLDHGMGLQSLYAHLSSIAVREGEDVRKGQALGKSGQTGLAGGDHLHFSMLLSGQFVNATEWWDSHWIEDRIVRKLREAGASLASVQPVRP